MLLGGFGGSYLYRLDCRYPAILAGLAAVGSCFPFWVLLNLVNASTSVLWTATIGFASGILSGITGPVIKATLQNVTLPQARGQAFALFNTFDDFGRGLGPVFVAGLVAGLGGRTAAFNVGVLGWAICGIFNLLIFCTVQRDEMTVQSTLLAQFSLQSSTSLSQDVGGTSDIDNEIQRDIV
jgi:sugar phosphate permease